MSERADGKLKLIDRYAGIPAVCLIGMFRRRRKIPSRIERIGLFKEACIGDTILLSGILDDLRKCYPAAKIVLFTGSTNHGVAKLLCGLDEAIKLPVTSPLKCIRTLRQHPVDVLLDFGQWPRINALYSWLWKSSFTIGFSTPGQHRHFAYDLAIPHRGDRHEVDNYRALATPLGVVSESKPRIVVPASSAPPPIEGEYVVFHPWPGGTLSHLREWACDRWVELARLLDGTGTKVVITGGPGDRIRAVQLADQIGLKSVENRAGLDDLPSVACLLSRARAVVSVNTGVMHLSAAIGVATIGLNGPTSELRWGPIGPKASSISVPPPFGGYLNLGFEYEGRPLDCMERITVQEVWLRLQQVLSA